MATSGGGGRGRGGRILWRDAGAGRCASGDDWTAGVCGSGESVGTVAGYGAVSGDGASGSLRGVERGGGRGCCPVLREVDGHRGELRKYLTPQAVVVSLQNGVNNAEEIYAASGIQALPAVVYVAAAIPAPGQVKHLGRGDLVIGPENEKTRSVANLFERAKVPCRISENIQGELWTKLVWNCALNAVSGLGRATYGDIIASEDAKRVVEAVVYEVLAVAQKKGIRPPGLEDPKVALAGAFRIAEQMSGTRSSTAQDMARGKKTEIDSLNGYVAKVGAELGVATPVNFTLCALVKLYESSFEKAQGQAS
jgi:2-dehydropantoate 2-reductase